MPQEPRAYSPRYHRKQFTDTSLFFARWIEAKLRAISSKLEKGKKIKISDVNRMPVNRMPAIRLVDPINHPL